MNDAILQLGVGGIFAVLVIREVLSFLNNKKSNSQDIIDVASLKDFFNKVQFKDNCVEVIKRFDLQFQSVDEYNKQRREYMEREFTKIDKRFDGVEHLIKNDNSK